MEPSGRVALVTGASSGIGLATARLLHGQGFGVALVARGRHRLDQVAAELGDGALTFPCDLRDTESLARLVSDVMTAFGRLDVLVNNAGLHHRGSMLRHSAQELADMLLVNTVAPVVLTRLVADVMPAGGCIVNVASLAGKLAVAGAATYSGSKAGMRFWAIAAADDLAERGIRIANVNPGPVDSGFFDDDIHNVAPITFSQPMSSPEECAEAVWKCIQSDRTPMEIDLPFASGKLATLGYISPQLRSALRPVLERQGARAKAAFIKRKGLG